MIIPTPQDMLLQAGVPPFGEYEHIPQLRCGIYVGVRNSTDENIIVTITRRSDKPKIEDWEMWR